MCYTYILNILKAGHKGLCLYQEREGPGVFNLVLSDNRGNGMTRFVLIIVLLGVALMPVVAEDVTDEWWKSRTVEACAVNHLSGEQCIHGEEAKVAKHPHDGAFDISEDKPSRQKGMPSDMHEITPGLLDKLESYIGKTVYLMPGSSGFYAGDKRYSTKSEPVETKLLAVYRGLEISERGEVVNVGAVALEKDMQSFTSGTFYISNGWSSSEVPEKTTYSCNLSDPRDVYTNPQEIYAELLAIFKRKLEKQIEYKADTMQELDNDKTNIEAAIDRVKKAIE